MPSSNHILMFPYPAQGHMLPMLDLAHKLSLNGLKLTILVTPKNLATLDNLLSTHPSIETLIIPFPSHPFLPSGVENVKEIGNSGNLLVVQAMGQLYGPILKWFKAHSSPPVAILSDFFLGWTLHLADELNIPRIVFYSSGAFLAAVSNSVWENAQAGQDLPVIDFPELPRSPSFKAEHLPTMWRVRGESSPQAVFFKDGMFANTSSWGCVFNTIDGLEGEYLDHLRKKLGHSRVWAVGPLCSEKRGRVDPDKVLGGHEVLTWLDSCPDGTVLYVCFGSQKFLKEPQMEALADGLEKSGVRFIWVVKPLSAQQIKNGYGSIPGGFKDRVSGRGLILEGWAPQVSILSHRATGGFLSHCGWNSVLEGILAGVTILAWPMEADQFVNARLLVEDIDVAIRVCEGPDTVMDSDVLARTAAKLMNGEGPQKVRVKELKDEAIGAINKGGSSWLDLEDLIGELSQMKVKIASPN